MGRFKQRANVVLLSRVAVFECVNKQGNPNRTIVCRVSGLIKSKNSYRSGEL